MSGEKERLILYAGSDELRVKEASAAKAAALGKSLGDFGMDVVEGHAEISEQGARICAQVLEALQTMPFLGGGKLVWLKNTNLLGDAPVTKTQDVSAGLAAVAQFVKEGIPEGVVFLISALEVDKRKAFFKAVEKVGTVHLMDAVSMEKDRDWHEKVEAMIGGRLEKAGFTVDQDALHLLTEMVGTDTMAMGAETEKLTLYKGAPGRITAQDVRDICSGNRDHVVWGLAEAVADRNVAEALQILKRLMAQGESAVGILATLTGRMRQLLLVSEMAAEKMLPPARDYNGFKAQIAQIAERHAGDLPSDKAFNPLLGHPYPLFLAAGKARHFTRQELVTAMKILHDANLSLVHSGADNRIVLESAILKIAGKPRSPVTTTRR